MKLACPQLLAVLAACAFSVTVAAEPPGLRDPMRPPQPAAQAGAAAARHVPQPPRVSGLFRSGERRVAVVDGKAVRVGDQVSGARIEAILDDGIRYRRGAEVGVARIARTGARVVRPRNAQVSGEGS